MKQETLKAINAIFCEGCRACVTLKGCTPSDFYTRNGWIYSSNEEIGTSRRTDLDIIKLAKHFDNMINQGGQIIICL